MNSVNVWDEDLAATLFEWFMSDDNNSIRQDYWIYCQEEKDVCICEYVERFKLNDFQRYLEQIKS